MRIGRGRDRARERERDKERKKRGNRKYGQAKLKHSKKGIMACVLSVIVAILFIALILTSFLHKGQSQAIIGSFGLFAVIIAWIGLVTAVRGFRERDKNYITCKVGIGVNGVVLLCLIATFIRGIV